MNARENFYSSVFEVINTYKNRGSEVPTNTSNNGFFADHLLETGVFSAALLVAVFSGFAFVYPRYMHFDRPVTSTPRAIAINQPSDSFAATAPPAPVLIRLPPGIDTYVSTSSASQNFGSLKALRVQAKPLTQSLLTYEVPPLATFNKASLLLPAISKSTAAVDVFVSSSFVWDESTFTNSDLPTSGFILASVVNDTSVDSEIDVTSYIRSNSSLTVLLRAKSGSVVYASREAESNETPMLFIE